MPAKTKLSPAARKAAQVAEDKRLVRQAKVRLQSTEAARTPNGTIVKIPFMTKSDGSFYVMETERRSRKKLIMKWRKLHDK